MNGFSVFAVVLVTALATSGCVSHTLTKAIVQAPNQRSMPNLLRPQGAERLKRIEQTYAASWMVDVASPPARIAVALIEPGDYALKHEVRSDRNNAGHYYIHPVSDWTTPAKPLPEVAAPKGTLLVLHGIQSTKEDLIYWALFFAQAGYRVVLVDLRGHGRSTGNWIGYGAFEVPDLVQVLDSVKTRGLITGPVGVFGISYGAAVALQFASRDQRIQSVVAMAPFSDPRRAVSDFARAVVPQYVKHWSADDFRLAEDRAGKMANLDWSAVDVLGSVQRMKAPVMYLLTENDRWVPAENTRALAEKTASPHAIATVTITGNPRIEHHVLMAWLLDPAARHVVDWFDTTLSAKPGEDLRARLTKLTGTGDTAPAGAAP